MITLKNFVGAKWLIDNKDDKDILILDARAELSDPLEGRRQYDEAHIKDAHFVSLEDTMTGEIEKHGGRHPLPDLNKFIEEMQGLGVSDRSKLIIYDDGNIAMAGRLWWIFKYIGKEEVYILEGGIGAFERMGGELSDRVPQVKKSGKLSLNPREDIRVDMEYLRENIDNEDLAIVDVRAHERYIGEVEPLDRIAGHIENALNYPWKDSFEGGKLMSLEELEKKFQDLREYEELVVHCGSGITGTVTVLLLDELGIDSKLYPGGYSDWISYGENKVFKGEN